MWLVYVLGCAIGTGGAAAMYFAGERLQQSRHSKVALLGEGLGVMSVPFGVAAIYCAGGVLYELMGLIYP